MRNMPISRHWHWSNSDHVWADWASLRLWYRVSVSSLGIESIEGERGEGMLPAGSASYPVLRLIACPCIFTSPDRVASHGFALVGVCGVIGGCSHTLTEAALSMVRSRILARDQGQERVPIKLLQCNDEQCQFEYRKNGQIEWASNSSQLVRGDLGHVGTRTSMQAPQISQRTAQTRCL